MNRIDFQSRDHILNIAGIVVTILAVLVAAETTSAMISCGDVSPCLAYAMGRASAPSAGYCSGVRNLKSRASSTADLQATCSCLKSMASRLGGVSMGNAAGIPGKCSVNIGMPISPSVDCSK
jgi:hypothetical protein